MAQPLAAPYSYFADANGAPLSGGKIYTYFAGTTNPQNSYTDASGVTPLSNPVILDSAGRAQIWLQGFYKIVVTDALGNTISTTDNITAITSTGNMNTAVYDPANIMEQVVGLTAVQTLTNKTIVKPNIIGTATADNAALGSVGEYISATVGTGSAVALTSGLASNVTSISLTAGDWDVGAYIGFLPAASTVPTRFTASITTNSGALAVDVPGSIALAGTYPTGVKQYLSISSTRILISVTTTIYLVGQCTFTTSTCGAYGYLSARRPR